MSQTNSVTVNISNNTGQGPITFQQCDFLTNTGGSFHPSGNPPIVTNPTIQDGQSLEAYNIVGIYDPDQGSSNTNVKGNVVFNLPNGSTITISYDLNAIYEAGINSPPTFTTTTDSYTIDGTTPVADSSNFNFTFNLVIS